MTLSSIIVPLVVQVNATFARKLDLAVVEGAANICKHTYGTAASVAPSLARQPFSGSVEALKELARTNMATSLQLCAPLISRLSLRSGRGGTKSDLQGFVDKATQLLRGPLEVLTALCSAHDFEHPIPLLVIHMPSENFAVVFETKDGAYSTLISEAGNHEHAYTSLASLFLGNNKDLNKGENNYRERKQFGAALPKLVSGILDKVKGM